MVRAPPWALAASMSRRPTAEAKSDGIGWAVRLSEVPAPASSRFAVSPPRPHRPPAQALAPDSMWGCGAFLDACGHSDACPIGPWLPQAALGKKEETGLRCGRSPQARPALGGRESPWRGRGGGMEG